LFRCLPKVLAADSTLMWLV